MSWTIKGEASKALDATERNVSDIATNLSIRYESLQSDLASPGQSWASSPTSQI
jgi:hypothetical protein